MCSISSPRGAAIKSVTARLIQSRKWIRRGIGRRVVCDAARHYAGDRHCKDVDIAVIFACESQGAAVGREDRAALDTGPPRQPDRAAA
jgi:hypothetical protein